MKKRYKKKRRPLTKGQKILFDVIIVFLAAVMVFSLYQIVSYSLKTKESKDDIGELVTEAVIYGDTEETPSENPTEPTEQTPKAPYYAKVPSAIDFNKLLAVNPEIEGWLFCENGVINYPVLHTDNNDYYLNHLYNGKKNANGSLFTDAVNMAHFGSENTVIHGHSMNNGTMFATLLRYKKQGYYDTYPCMYLFTPDKKYRLDFFAGYVAEVDDTWYTTGFRSEEDFNECLNYALNKSYIKTKTTPKYGDKFITLSTCSYENNNVRFLLIGKMVPLD